MEVQVHELELIAILKMVELALSVVSLVVILHVFGTVDLCRNLGGELLALAFLDDAEPDWVYLEPASLKVLLELGVTLVHCCF